MEHFRLREGGGVVRLEGTVLLAHEEGPLRVEYEVECDASWETRAVRVAVATGGGDRELRLTVDGERRWRRDGEEIPALAGCADVDISVSPSTNTLPIRRLALPPGAGRDVTAAWVRLPALTVEPLAQRYTRLDARRWRYESGGGSFTAELEVDDVGLVVRYPPGWERVG
jgi:hypothetical protein